MSDRMRKHRQKLADEGKKVVELVLPIQLVRDFQVLADYHNLNRTDIMSRFITNICNDDSFIATVRNAKLNGNPLVQAIKAKHRKEFTDYTLS